MSVIKASFWVLTLATAFLLTVGEEYECGTVQDSIHFISGGDDYRSMPWMASIGQFKDNVWRHECGATIIDHEYILTAAHCVVYRENDRNITLLLGVHDFSNEQKMSEAEVIEVEFSSVFVHPKFRDREVYFDLAVIQVRSIEFNHEKNAICLPSQSFKINAFDGDKVEIAGWGNFEPFSNNGSETLRSTSVQIFPYKYCNESHEQSGFEFKRKIKQFLPNLFPPYVFCAGDDEAGHSSCRGDSGGPLQKKNIYKKQYTQYGIIELAFERLCGGNDFPTIFTRLDYPEILGFLRQFVKHNTSDPVETVTSDSVGLNFKQCGIKDDLRTVAAGSAFEHWPWMASFGYDKNGTWKHKCGGTIIHQYYILTAAHCIDEFTSSSTEMVFQLGAFDLQKLKESENVIERKILQIYVHPKYSSPQFYFDVAIVKVEKIEFHSSIKQICLPQNPTKLGLLDKHAATIAGWGLYDPVTMSSSNTLRTDTMQIFPFSYCNKTWSSQRGTFLPELFQDSLLCAGDINKVKGSCKGDSGGPLKVSDLENEQYIQIGIVTGGKGDCGERQLPSVFARIDYYEILFFIFDILEHPFPLNDLEPNIVPNITLGEWEEWGDFSDCTDNCKRQGTRQRIRECQDEVCFGPTKEIILCKRNHCHEGES